MMQRGRDQGEDRNRRAEVGVPLVLKTGDALRENHLALAVTGLQGHEGKKIRDEKQEPRRDRESGGAMDGVSVIVEKTGAAARAGCLLAFADRGRVEKQVAVGTGQMFGSARRLHGRTVALERDLGSRS